MNQEQFIEHLLFELDDILQDVSFDISTDCVPYEKLKELIEKVEEYKEENL
jgi:hypothetical protein